jgi:hypothetical protein
MHPRKLLHALRRLVAANPLDGYRLAVVPARSARISRIERMPAKGTSIAFSMPIIDLGLDESEPVQSQRASITLTKPVIKIRIDEPDPSNLERSEPCA